MLQFIVVCALGCAGFWVLSALVLSASGLFQRIIGGGFYLFASAVALVGLARGYPHPSLGLCNGVTLVRLMLVGVLLAAFVGALIGNLPNPWALFAVAVPALALDGVDGWLARRQGHESAFGARFDMEVDSTLALTLALLAVVVAGVSPFVVLLGLPRYVFGVAQMVLPWLVADLPPRFSRKVVCVLQMLVLISVLLPSVPLGLANALVLGGLLLVGWSFAVDVRWLWRARR